VVCDIQLNDLAFRLLLDVFCHQVSSLLVVDVDKSNLGVSEDPFLRELVVLCVIAVNDSSDLISLSLRPVSESSILFNEFLVEEDSSKGVQLV